MCRFEICFSDKPIGFDDGWTVGGKERKESRMTLWFLLDSQYGWGSWAHPGTEGAREVNGSEAPLCLESPPKLSEPRG